MLVKSTNEKVSTEPINVTVKKWDLHTYIMNELNGSREISVHLKNTTYFLLLRCKTYSLEKAQ